MPTNLRHADPATWPAEAEAPIVCDGCHVDVDRLAETGHLAPCDLNGRHMHHRAYAIETCLFWLEYRHRLRNGPYVYRAWYH